MRLPELLCVLVCVCAAPGPVAGSDRSCSDLPQFYTGKGFTLADVPQTEMSGEFRRKMILHKIKQTNKQKNPHNFIQFTALNKSVCIIIIPK